MSVTEFYSCEPIDIFIFIEERSGEVRRREQQEWNYTRHIMLASMQPYSNEKIRLSSIIRLDIDGDESTEWTPEQEAEMEAWGEKCDNEMIESGAVFVDWDGNPIND